MFDLVGGVDRIIVWLRTQKSFPLVEETSQYLIFFIHHIPSN